MKWLLPPVLVATLLIAMAILNNIIPTSPIFANKSTTLIGLPLILVGASFVIIIAYTFKKIETNINTFNKPDKLVTSGLFKRTRNPIYLGFLLILIGATLLFNSYITIFGPLIFFLAANFWYIPFEEKAAAEQFGDDYFIYKNKVRRWI